jgi:hypothetical protein
MSDGANTMIEHDDTLPSQLGTMVINAEDEEEEGTMKSKALMRYTNFSDNAYTFQRTLVHIVHIGSVLSPLFCCHNQSRFYIRGLCRAGGGKG